MRRITAVGIRRAARHTVHKYQLAAVEHPLAQFAADGDADLLEAQAIPEGVIADAFTLPVPINIRENFIMVKIILCLSLQFKDIRKRLR